MQGDFGAPSALTCPDCGGALWEIVDGQLVRYRCHVGHQYTIDGLDAGQRDAVEAALWTAVRMLEERAELRERMAQRATNSGIDAVAEGFASSAREAQQQAATIRGLLFGHSPPASAPLKKPKPVARRKGGTRPRRR
jgi:two-component system chemotaxis response regulator CheB